MHIAPLFGDDNSLFQGWRGSIEDCIHMLPDVRGVSSGSRAQGHSGGAQPNKAMGRQGGPTDLHPPRRWMMLVRHNACTSLQCVLVTKNMPHLRLTWQQKGGGGRGGGGWGAVGV